MSPALSRTACFAALLGTTILGGCSAATRLSQIGEMPPLTTIQDPHQQPGYRPVSLPMPTPIVGERRPNSLWQAGSRAFFKDQRASQVGDILTININFDEKAKFDNETQRQRTAAENEGVNNLFGLEAKIPKILSGANPASLVDVSGSSNHDGKAQMDREEQVNLQVAALVMQVLPNGNLVVQGHQELRVNYEVREIQITGVIRPQDISSINTVDYFKLAEARISYGGRGQLMDVQQPRYGQQLLDIVAPF
jgi:flagellar L-ring protein precursor FlgH